MGFKLALLGVVLFEPEMNFDFLLPAQEDVLTAWQQPDAQPVAQSALEAGPEFGAEAATEFGAEAATEFGAEAATKFGKTQNPAQVNAAPQVAAQTQSVATVNAANAAQSVQPATQARPAIVSRRAPGVAFAATPASITSGQAMPQGQVQSGALSLDALNRKQEELARKEQDIKQLQTELDDRFAQLQGLEQRLKIMLKDADELKDARYRHLVDVLANMKARQAAEVLSTLDEKIAVRVLAGMQGRQAGEILSFADPVKAARLTEALARMQMPLE